MDQTNLHHAYDIWLTVATARAEDATRDARNSHELRLAHEEVCLARQALQEAECDLRSAGADQETLAPLRHTIAGLGRLLVVIGQRLEQVEPAESRVA